MHVAIVGTRGVPARYGGFETAVEQVGSRLAQRGHRVTVYCRNPEQQLTEYRGMSLVTLPAVRRRSLETLSHAGLSSVHAIVRSRPDAVLVFNAANAPYVPMLRAAGLPVAVHVDGLEWRRAKWDGVGQRYFRWAEERSVRWANACVADAEAIAGHLAATYGRSSVFIPYGADIIEPGHDGLEEFGLAPGGYHLVVARMEPENHVLEIVQGHARSHAALPLVVVGAATYSSDYEARVHAAARASDRETMVGAVWNQELLDQLYGNCATYLHGHSVGGTNPSLLRAMGAGAPVIAHDNVFNREVTGGHAFFFSDSSGVAASIEQAEREPENMRTHAAAARQRAASTYRWDDVTDRYEQLAQSLASHHTGSKRLGRLFARD